MITHAFDFENKTNRQVLDALNAILAENRGDYDEYRFGLNDWSSIDAAFPFDVRGWGFACHAIRGANEGYWAHIAHIPLVSKPEVSPPVFNYRLWSATKCWCWENAFWMANTAQRFFDQ